MKIMMFAALAAALAAPALAQTTPTTTPAQDPGMAQSAPSNGSTMTPPTTSQTSDPAMAQPGAPMSTPDANMSRAMPSSSAMPASGSYPMCSRTVVDQCRERSNARGERLHSTPRPR